MAEPRLRWIRLPHAGDRSRWLELAVAVALLGLLVWFAIDRIWAIRVAAERAGVEQAVGSLRNAVGVAAFQRSATHGLAGIAALDGANPMALLERAPASYVGEREGSGAEDAAPGSWYFDRRRRALVYRPRFPEAFAEQGGRPTYRITFAFRDRDGNGRFDPGIDGVRGLDLRPIPATDPGVASDKGS